MPLEGSVVQSQRMSESGFFKSPEISISKWDSFRINRGRCNAVM